MRNENQHLTDKCDYVPTPEQICQITRRIQKTWSDRERRFRAGLPRDRPRIELEPQYIEIDERGTLLE